MWTVDTGALPQEMMRSEVNEDGWVEWNLMKGTLTQDDYRAVEEELNIKYPQSFIDWHKAYYFLDGVYGLFRLPKSNPYEPLKELRNNIDWYAPEYLFPKRLYQFADEGNDTGPLVFDARSKAENDEFSIRVYDHEYGGELEGLSEVIFSSFPKLLECITHFLESRGIRKDFEIIPDFFEIDPTGAGSTGREYWEGWIEMLKVRATL